MIKVLIALLFLTSQAFAATGVNIQDANGNYQGSSGNPLVVHCVSGCSGSGGSGLWESNNVGIDTFNNVGIGSTNPGATLDVNGTVRAIAYTGLTTGDVILNPTANNVGIGTVTTTALLTVKGKTATTTFQMTNGAVNGYFLTGDASGNATWALGGAAPGGTQNQMQYYLTSSTLGGVANSGSDGTNVGLGTLTPTATLTIQKNSTTDLFRADSSNQAGGNVFLIQNGGNVGVGSTNPGALLDVKGTLRIISSSPTNLTTNVGIGTTNIPLNLLDVAGGVSIGSTNATYHAAPSNGVIVQGNVGIGTLTAPYGLTIFGNIGINSFGHITAPVIKALIPD